MSGKYLNGQKPANASNPLFRRFTRDTGEKAAEAVSAYVALAQQHHLDPSQMALAFVRQQPFVASTLLGATTLQQLKINIDSFHLTLDEELMQQLEAIHRRYTYPAP